MDQSVSILTTRSKNAFNYVYKVGNVQTVMSDFCYERDRFYYSAEGTKESSENSKLDEEKKKFRRQGLRVPETLKKKKIKKIKSYLKVWVKFCH